jgi:hypothetical protein
MFAFLARNLCIFSTLSRFPDKADLAYFLMIDFYFLNEKIYKDLRKEPFMSI